MTTTADLEALPKDGVLLHIGPHKTGTTAIQAALAASRGTLARHGATYPGHGNQHSSEAMGVLGLTFGFRERGGGTFPLRDWDRLVARVGRARRRVVISSEFFDAATGDQVEQVCSALGGERVHVIVTLRSLARILPSSWQQTLKSGRRRPYDGWLRMILDPPTTRTRRGGRPSGRDTTTARWWSGGPVSSAPSG